VQGLSDGFSLRIVDPGRALRMRGYSGPDAQLTIRVTDESGVAAGTWLVRVSGGQATVEPSSHVPDITLAARELAATFLGTTRTTALLDAGVVTATPEAANALDALLRWPREASSSLHF
jgi:predicted acetyltransferase